MALLVAERFVCVHDVSISINRRFGALDLATGATVGIRIDPAGDRTAQQLWSESCGRRRAAGKLVDFGFIGADRRFEATCDDMATPHPYVSAGPVLEWLETTSPSSRRLLALINLPDPRELRIRGFVPAAIALVSDFALGDLRTLVGGRSVALLAATSARADVALATVKLRSANAREVFVLAMRPSAANTPAVCAAETRAAYGAASPGDARIRAMLGEAERQLATGRHASAERALRAAIGASDRRKDTFHAGLGEMMLGNLLLTRGRPAHAKGLFDSAHERFQLVRAPAAAVQAMIHSAIAQTDTAMLPEAEASCRAAHAAAAALDDHDLSTAAATALARTLLSQQRYREAQGVLDTTLPQGDAETCARYWCLAARVAVADSRLKDVCRAIARARPSNAVCSPPIECLVRRCEATLQAELGDVEALTNHVRVGLAAARSAHLPLEALKFRLVLVQGLFDADQPSRARAAAARVRAFSRASIPQLLKQQIDNTLERVHRPATSPPKREGAPDRARETAAVFRSSDAVDAVQDLESVRHILTVAHQLDSENAALTHAVDSVRAQMYAASVVVYGMVTGCLQPLATSGAQSLQTVRGCRLGQRCFDAGIAIGPENADGGVEAAVPVRYLGRVIGALAVRWSAEGPAHPGRAVAFVSAAAAACAPLVFLIVERSATPTPTEAPFDLLGASDAMEAVRKAVARAADAPFAVLIEGESGSGKELVARAIHRAGCRRERRLCALNCAAMPEDLIDAELFGHAKGAFTGAAVERLGLFESADGGTVFLDEVGELSPRAQAKVLRALQEGEVRRLGEQFTRPFDARVVAATNRPLRAEVEAGRFRRDLLYRLDVIRIVVPPLRERAEDIPLLAARFWRHSTERIGTKAVLGQSAIAALARYDWPGNVRELQNVLAALAVSAPSRGVVGASQLPAAVARAAPSGAEESLESARIKFERRFVRAALARAAGHRGRAAAALGLSRQGFSKLMRRLKLEGSNGSTGL